MAETEMAETEMAETEMAETVKAAEAALSVRAGGIAGLAFVAISLVAFMLVSAPPDVGADAAEIKEYLLDNRSGGLAQAALIALTLPCFLVFIEALRRRAGEDRRLAWLSSSSAAAGGIGYLSAVLGAAAFYVPVWHQATGEAAPADMMLGWWYSGYLLYLVSFPVLALFVGGMGWCARSSGSVPGWLGWLSAVVAAVLAVGTAGILSPEVAAASSLAYFLLLAWVLVTAIMLLRGAPTEPGSR